MPLKHLTNDKQRGASGSAETLTFVTLSGTDSNTLRCSSRGI